MSNACHHDGGSLFPKFGLGLGLRNKHFDHILATWPAVDWFEAISENFMDSGGKPGYVLRRVAERYPIALHGVSLSVGSTSPLDLDYLTKLKTLADDVKAAWVSDHLCWTGVLGVNSHDLLPLPLNEETLKHVGARVRRVQEILERPLVLENPSTYVSYNQTAIEEPEFLRLLCTETGCRLLLDVNNVYVTCFNAGSDPEAYLEAFPFDKVVQIHLAGHQRYDDHAIDTHDQPVCNAVWELFRIAWQRTGGASTLLEWDGRVPSLEECHAEVLKANRYMGGRSDPEYVQDPCPRDTESISTPVGFLVPEVMAETKLEAM